MNNKQNLIGIFFAVLVLLPLGIFGESAEDIIAQVDRRQTSDSEISELSMTVIDDISDMNNRKVFRLESFSRKGEEDGELSVFFFREPRRLAGMAILSRDDGQWVYFPSTGRVRLLSGAAKGGSINGVGGDFSYEDLGTGNWGEDYNFSLISSDETLWKLEGIPSSDDVNYLRIIMEIHKNDYIPRRIEFYKGKSNPEKIMTIREVSAFNGRMNPAVIEMDNPSKNSRTLIEIHKMEFDRPLNDNLFHPRQFYR